MVTKRAVTVSLDVDIGAWNSELALGFLNSDVWLSSEFRVGICSSFPWNWATTKRTPSQYRALPLRIERNWSRLQPFAAVPYHRRRFAADHVDHHRRFAANHRRLRRSRPAPRRSFCADHHRWRFVADCSRHSWSGWCGRR